MSVACGRRPMKALQKPAKCQEQNVLKYKKLQTLVVKLKWTRILAQFSE